MRNSIKPCKAKQFSFVSNKSDNLILEPKKIHRSSWDFYDTFVEIDYFKNIKIDSEDVSSNVSTTNSTQYSIGTFNTTCALID
jgi:hypothetical protein